jgi:hypothetical protein
MKSVAQVCEGFFIMTWQDYILQHHPPAENWEVCNHAYGLFDLRKIIVEELDEEVMGRELLTFLADNNYPTDNLNGLVVYLTK